MRWAPWRLGTPARPDDTRSCCGIVTLLVQNYEAPGRHPSVGPLGLSVHSPREHVSVRRIADRWIAECPGWDRMDTGAVTYFRGTGQTTADLKIGKL